MMEMNDFNSYIDINRKFWDEATPYHVNSPFYSLDNSKKSFRSLNEIELNLLGDVSGKEILHLQCHFGQDSLSLQQMGASVTGVDFSPVAIEAAREKAMELRLDARFLCSDVYSLPEKLDKKFDMVFTSYGVLGWLPDMERWAAVVSHFLKPGGRLVLVEFHPFIWTFDNDFRAIAYDYFKGDAIIETNMGTYADKSAPIVNTTVSWNHALTEVINPLLRKGMRLDTFLEFDYSPYDCLPGLEQYEEGKFRFTHIKHRIPMVYALVAVR